MKYCVTLSFLLIYTVLTSQSIYTFDQDSRAYTALSSGTLLSEQNWMEVDTVLRLPFEIDLFGTVVDEILVGEGALLYEDDNEDILIALSIFGADYQASGILPEDSQVLYIIEGSSGSRTLTIEWRSLYFTYLDGFFDFVNFQFRYYEAGGQVEYHYGPSETELIDIAYTERNQDFGSIIGLGTGTVLTLENGVFLEGAPGNLSVIRDTLGFHATFPMANRVYRFTPMVTSTHNPKDAHTPCLMIKEQSQDAITIEKLQDGPLHLVTMEGKHVLTTEGDEIFLSDLKSGIYFLVAPECQESQPIIIAR